MKNQNSTAAKNAGKKSAHSVKVELNKLFNDENLSLNAVFKFFAGKGKAGLKTWLSEFNNEQKAKGLPELLTTDFNLKFFLELVKGKTKTYKGEQKALLPETKTKFSAAYVLDCYKIALR